MGNERSPTEAWFIVIRRVTVFYRKSAFASTEWSEDTSGDIECAAGRGRYRGASRASVEGAS